MCKLRIGLRIEIVQHSHAGKAKLYYENLRENVNRSERRVYCTFGPTNVRTRVCADARAVRIRFGHLAKTGQTAEHAIMCPHPLEIGPGFQDHGAVWRGCPVATLDSVLLSCMLSCSW
jgi:hypothetical protein